MLSIEKLKANIFDWTQIWEHMKNHLFLRFNEQCRGRHMILVPSGYWDSLKNTKADNYSESILSMLSSFSQLGCMMSTKVYYLHSHMNHLQESIEDLRS